MSSAAAPPPPERRGAAATSAATAPPAGQGTATAAGTAASPAATATTATTSTAASLAARREPPRRRTPEVLRSMSRRIAAAAAAFGVLALFATANAASSAEALRDSTGPVLVAAQDVRASLAEANAAQATGYLALPVDDLAARRLYEDALERATGQLEEVAARAGDADAVHDAVKDVAAEVTTFAGLVESARATRQLAGSLGAAVDDDAAARAVALAEATADGHLVDAQVQLTGPVDDAVGRMVAAATADADLAADLDPFVIATVVAGLVVLSLVLVASVELARRTRRVLNPGLVVAAVALVVAIAWTSAAVVSAQGRLAEAVDDGYPAIETAAALQQAAFAAQADAVVEAVTPEQPVAVDEQLAEVDRLVDELAAQVDNRREQALTDELEVRLARWRAALDAARAVDATGARRAAQDATTDPFRGFVFALDGVVADNRDQFVAGLDDAASPLGVLPLALLALGLGAGIAAVLGIRPRLEEYR